MYKIYLAGAGLGQFEPEQLQEVWFCVKIIQLKVSGLYYILHFPFLQSFLNILDFAF